MITFTHGTQHSLHFPIRVDTDLCLADCTLRTIASSNQNSPGKAAKFTDLLGCILKMIIKKKKNIFRPPPLRKVLLLVKYEVKLRAVSVIIPVNSTRAIQVKSVCWKSRVCVCFIIQEFVIRGWMSPESISKVRLPINFLFRRYHLVCEVSRVRQSFHALWLNVFLHGLWFVLTPSAAVECSLRFVTYLS